MANKKLDLSPLYEWGMFTEPRPSVVAGPCSAETEEQVKGRLKAAADEIFRMKLMEELGI